MLHSEELPPLHCHHRGHVQASPAGARFTTVKLRRLNLTEGALKLRLDTG